MGGIKKRAVLYIVRLYFPAALLKVKQDFNTPPFQSEP